jgi:hypothetical protein
LIDVGGDSRTDHRVDHALVRSWSSLPRIVLR